MYLSYGKEVTVDGQLYEDLLQDIPSISYTSDRLGGFIKVNNISFSIANQESYSNVFQASNAYGYNAVVTCYLLFEDSSVSSYTINIHCLKLFTGKIREYPSIDENTLSFSVDAYNEFVEKDFYASQKTLEEYADEYSFDGGLNIDDCILPFSAGKSAVQKYFVSDEFDREQWSGVNTMHGLREITRIENEDGTGLKRVLSGCSTTLYSSENLKAFIVGSGINIIEILPSDYSVVDELPYGTFFEFGGSAGVPLSEVRGQECTFGDFTNDYDDFLVFFVGAAHHTTGSGVHDHDDSSGTYDGGNWIMFQRDNYLPSDSWTVFDLITSGTESGEPGILVFCPIKEPEVLDTSVGTINAKVCFYLQLETADTAQLDNLFLIIGVENEHGTMLDQDEISNLNPYHSDVWNGNSMVTLDLEIDVSNGYPIYLVAQFGGTAQYEQVNVQLKVFKMYMAYEGVIDSTGETWEDETLYFEPNGLKQPDWLINRTGHAESGIGLDGDLIPSTGASVIEIVLRDSGMERPESKINTDSFDVFSHLHPTVSFCAHYLEKNKINGKVIDELAQSTRCLIQYDENEKLAVRNFPTLTNNFASGSSYPEGQDIFEYRPTRTFNVVASDHYGADWRRILFQDSGGTNRSAYLNGGEYTGSELAAEAQRAMRAVTSDSINVIYGGENFGDFRFLNFGSFTIDWTNLVRPNRKLFGFKYQDSTGGNYYISDYKQFSNSFVEHGIVKDSFKLFRKTKVYNKITLEMPDKSKRVYDDTASQATHGIIEKQVKYKLSTEPATLDFYGNSLLARHSNPKWGCEFDVTGTSPLMFELWDIVNVRHPLLDGIFGTGSGETETRRKKWFILDMNFNAGDMMTRVKLEEI